MTVLINRNVLRITVHSTTQYDLGVAVSKASNIKYDRLEATIPAGTVIGSGDHLVPAFTTGDLDQFPGGIVVNNYGEIQGAGGDWNSGNGGTALYINSPLLEFNNYGAVRGGGGGGGKGADGAPGDWCTAWSQQAWSDKAPKYMFVTTTCPGSSNPCWWNGTKKGAACKLPYIKHTDGHIYTYGAYNPGYPTLGGQFRYIKRGAYRVGVPGKGGGGGAGRGYNRNWKNGVAGTNGTYYAGKGGTGGRGGDWGAKGSIGNGSGWGSKFNLSSHSESGGTAADRITTTGSTFGNTGGNAGQGVFGTTVATSNSYFNNHSGGVVNGSNNMPSGTVITE